jgi:hypothetical protein
MVFDLEPDIIRLKIHFPAPGFVQQGHHPEGTRPAGLETLQEVLQGYPRVDDVFHDEDVFAPQGSLQILGDFYFPRRLGFRSITGQADKVHFHGRSHFPGQIGHENESPFQDPDKEDFPALKISGYLPGERPYLALNLFLRQEQLHDKPEYIYFEMNCKAENFQKFYAKNLMNS